ncbi:MAG: hypothetical protein AAF557_26110 [Pseudomonadota bacterium]
MAQELAKAESIDQAESTDQIVITLHEEEGSDVFIRSVDLFISSMKVRFSARSTSSVESVFQNEFADLIRRICRSSTLAKEVINVPDCALRAGGLAIRGYTLLVHTLDNGMRQFILRLKQATGNALALFRPSDTPGQGLSMFSTGLVNSNGTDVRSNRLFDEMLSHIYLPLVNLNSYLKHVLDGERNGSPDQLGSSIVQLKTKAEMLQFAFDRLISEVMLDKYTKPTEPELVPAMLEQRSA